MRGIGVYGSLGLVASSKRTIKSGKEFNSCFDGKTVKGEEVELSSNEDAHGTIQLMKKMVSRSLDDTSEIAQKLKGKSLQSTCSNVWNFLYNHVQYKKDHDTREQLRTPARTWKDRSTGVDCDCYTIFISSVLTNLSIPHMMRIAAYKGDYQHVYVIVPKNGKSVAGNSTYFVIDPVVNRFNYEVPYSKKSDAMPRVTMLNGFGACDDVPVIDKLRHFLPMQQIIQKGGVPSKEFLKENGIAFVPGFDKAGNRSVYVVCTPKGQIIVPTVMSPAQAEALKTAVGPLAASNNNSSPTSSTDSNAPASSGDQSSNPDWWKKIPWWWIAIGFGGYVLLTGDDQSEVQTGLKGTPKSGLNGPPKKKKKAARKAISI